MSEPDNIRIEYGALEETTGRHRPIIKVGRINGVEILYTANVTFDDIDSARKFCVAVYKTLSGPQKNFRYDIRGGA